VVGPSRPAETPSTGSGDDGSGPYIHSNDIYRVDIDVATPAAPSPAQQPPERGGTHDGGGAGGGGHPWPAAPHDVWHSTASSSAAYSGGRAGFAESVPSYGAPAAGSGGSGAGNFGALEGDALLASALEAERQRVAKRGGGDAFAAAGVTFKEARAGGQFLLCGGGNGGAAAEGVDVWEWGRRVQIK
jgi:hypothetical protein